MNCVSARALPQKVTRLVVRYFHAVLELIIELTISNTAVIIPSVKIIVSLI